MGRHVVVVLDFKVKPHAVVKLSVLGPDAENRVHPLVTILHVVPAYRVRTGYES